MITTILMRQKRSLGLIGETNGPFVDDQTGTFPGRTERVVEHVQRP